MTKRKLKDYSIDTKIIIKEWRERYKEGDSYEQPFKCFSIDISDGHGKTMIGGLKNKKELIKALTKGIG